MNKEQFKSNYEQWTKDYVLFISKIIDSKYNWNIHDTVEKLYSEGKPGLVDWAILKSAIPKTFCRAPFDRLQIDPDGHAKPCCKYKLGSLPDPNEKSSPTSNLKELWNQEEFQELRDQFMKGERPSGCSICWQEEDSGVKSLRQVITTDRFEVPENVIFDLIPSSSPVYLDFKLSNICNLKCRICNPFLSSQWIKEYKDLKLAEGSYWKYTQNSQERLFANPDNESILKEWAKNVFNVEFYGGEPLLQQEHRDILTLLSTYGNPQDTELFYNTNGTIFEEDFFDHWRKFRRVRINFSIDDVSDRFEYQRKNAKWNEVLGNIKKFKEYSIKYNVKSEFTIYCTIGILNVFYIPEFLETITEVDVPVWFNLVHWPFHFAIKNLPPDVKDYIQLKLETIDTGKFITHTDSISLKSVIQFMTDNESNLEEFATCLKTINLHDEYRKESFEKTFPELFELIKHYV